MTKGSGHIVALLLLYFIHPVVLDHRVRARCPPDVSICEIELVMTEGLTMSLPKDSGMSGLLDFDEQGNMYRLKGYGEKELIENIDLSQIPLGDGSHKHVLLYNNQLPGPPIVVYEGQQVVVKLWNKMRDQGTTVHFHGAKQHNTPWMDGVAGVSQCDILPGERFTYRFIASPAGTHWYHSHYGTQRTMGAAGAFVVLERDEDTIRQTGTDSPLPEFADDFVMLMQDWHRETTEDISVTIAYDTVKYPFNFNTSICYNSTKQYDGVDSGVIPFVSALINGRGRYMGHDVRYPNPTFVPFEIYKVQKGGYFRFRVVGASMLYPFKVSIDHHPIYLIATDGFHLRTQKMDAITVFNGERYDFYIEATDPLKVGNYWIRVQTLEVTQNGKKVEAGQVKAILRYEGAPDVDPTTSSRLCTKSTPCHIYNCPYTSEVTSSDNIMCHPLTDLRLNTPEPVMQPEEGEEIEEYFLNFHFAFNSPDATEKPTVNGIQHKHAVSSPMTFPDAPDGSTKHCHFTSCKTGLCRECEHHLHLPLNKIIQFNLAVTVSNAPGVINGNDHPVHIHGHSVQVLKVAYPYYEPIYNTYNKTNTDFKCTTEDCNTLVWRNQSWEGGRVPGLLQEGAPRKDTLVIPVGGYTVIRFKTDNPGFWFMHCHVEFHNAEGMGIVLRTGNVSEMNAKPRGMRTCSDFIWPDVEVKDVEEQAQQCREENNMYRTLVVIMGVVATVLTTTNILFICDNRLAQRSTAY